MANHKKQYTIAQKKKQQNIIIWSLFGGIAVLVFAVILLNALAQPAKGKEVTEDVVIRLFDSAAPITTENFKNLVADKFYDKLTFHRIIKGFMIQGGDPEGTGNGGADKDIKGEFSSNGWTGNAGISHTRGVVSMARSNDPDSASSQFFIVHEDSPHLDGDYAAFGYVVYGMSTVDGIASVKTDEDYFPLTKVTIKSAVFMKEKEPAADRPAIDYSSVKLEDLVESDQPTNYVKISITYTKPASAGTKNAVSADAPQMQFTLSAKNEMIRLRESFAA